MDESRDEPMDDSALIRKPIEEKAVKLSSILKPGSMVMMTITVEEYEEHYWPKLESAINQLLTMTPGEYIPISYEQMYSCVYKCVCKQFSERLYKDLLNYMKKYLGDVSQKLEEISFSHHVLYIETFSKAMTQYIQALSGIVPIFNYMNRFYIENKLRTDLSVELRKLFTLQVAEKHVHTLLSYVTEAQKTPFLLSPQIMSSLVKNLFLFKPEFAKICPELFAQYIPNILPPSSMSDLDRHIEETKIMQDDLVQRQGFTRGDRGRKRSGDEEMQNKSI